MVIAEQTQSLQKYDRLVIVSFVFGLMTIVFPIIAIFYLLTENGGPGYLQSLFCGVPVAVLSITTGIASLMQKTKRQKGVWMATLGIVLGSLFYVVFFIMVLILLFPFLLGVAH